MMCALGAEVVLVEQAAGSTPGMVSGADLDLVREEAERIVRKRGAWRADQFRHAGAFRAHFLHTGPEIWRQSGGQVNAFCDFVGSGSTFAGCAAALKSFNSRVRCYIVEPEGAAVLAGEPLSNPNHRIQGGGYSMPQLAFLRSEHIDGYVAVSDTEAIATARCLARQEGIFAGFSSGANVAAALKLLDGPCQGATIAVMICDSGLKYLSTDLWEQ
jgi:cysteine synthase A